MNTDKKMRNTILVFNQKCREPEIKSKIHLYVISSRQKSIDQSLHFKLNCASIGNGPKLFT